MPRRKRSSVEPLPAGVYRATVQAIEGVHDDERPKRGPHPQIERYSRPKVERKYTRRWKLDLKRKPEWDWTFLISLDDGTERMVTDHTSRRSTKRYPLPKGYKPQGRLNQTLYGEDSKAIQWFQAIVNEPLRSGYIYDVFEAVGLACNVTLSVEKGRNRVVAVSRKDWD